MGPQSRRPAGVLGRHIWDRPALRKQEMGGPCHI